MIFSLQVMEPYYWYDMGEEERKKHTRHHEHKLLMEAWDKGYIFPYGIERVVKHGSTATPTVEFRAFGMRSEKRVSDCP